MNWLIIWVIMGQRGVSECRRASCSSLSRKWLIICNCWLCYQDGRTSLHVAIWQKHPDVVRSLIRHKADPDLQDDVRTEIIVHPMKHCVVVFCRVILPISLRITSLALSGAIIAPMPVKQSWMVWVTLPYPSGLLHWHWGNQMIAPVPVKHPWRTWVSSPNFNSLLIYK